MAADPDNPPLFRTQTYRETYRVMDKYDFGKFNP
jgi:hypothetical protein